MATKTRVPNKVIWGLEDILALCIDARESCRDMQARALQEMDAIMLASLVELIDQVSQIEGKARDAREGKYRQRGGNTSL